MKNHFQFFRYFIIEMFVIVEKNHTSAYDKQYRLKDGFQDEFLYECEMRHSQQN